MEFLGKNKLFELALEYFAIELEDAFEKIKKISYETVVREHLIIENLFFIHKDGRIDSVNRFFYEDLDEEKFNLSFMNEDGDKILDVCVLQDGYFVKKDCRILNEEQEKQCDICVCKTCGKLPLCKPCVPFCDHNKECISCFGCKLYVEVRKGIYKCTFSAKDDDEIEYYECHCHEKETG